MGKNLLLRIVLLLFVNVLIGVEIEFSRLFTHMDTLAKYILIISLVIADILAAVAIVRVYGSRGD